MEKQLRARDRANSVSTSAVATQTYDKNECCWQCKQQSHTRFDCRRIPRRFCSQCRKDGVFTRDCHPPPGNARRNRGQRSLLEISFRARPYTTVRLAGEAYDVLIDTGSELTLVSAQTARRLCERRVRTSLSREHICVADGTSTPIREILRVSVRVGARRI